MYILYFVTIFSSYFFCRASTPLRILTLNSPYLSQVTPLREGVSSFAAATFDRWIYVIGGGPNGRMASDLVQCWEPGTDSWELRASIPIETKCTCAVTFKNSIYIVGEYEIKLLG